MWDRPRRHVLSTCIEIVEGHMERTKERINYHASWPSGDDVARLRKKLEPLKHARGVLISIQK